MGLTSKKSEKDENTVAKVPSGATTSAKRALMLTPPSSQKDAKKSRGVVDDDDDVNRAVCGAVGMDYIAENSSEPAVSTSDIHECILTRVNEALRGTRITGASDGDSNLLQQIVPAIVTAVAVAVAEAIDRFFRQREKEVMPLQMQQIDSTLAGLQKNILLLKYENDSNEQYSRRETVRIFGIPESGATREEGGEMAEADPGGREVDLESKILKVFADSGTTIRPEDISTIHRTGQRRRGGNRPVLVRFVSRKKKVEVMRAKKNLKGKQGYQQVFINEDLTALRAKLLRYVKDLPTIEKAWTSEGKIWAKRKTIPGQTANNGGNKTVVAIENPDHLFRLGVDQLDYARLGLDKLLCM